MKTISIHFIIISFFILSIQSSYAKVLLPGIFSDHMVLQQNTEVNIWGWARSTEEVKLVASWAPLDTLTTRPSENTYWSISVQTPAAGGPYSLIIEGSNRLEIEDILIGEVWLGSGQSNMEWSAQLGINDADLETKNARFPEIRFFSVPIHAADHPQQQVIGKWVKCTPETMHHFSALMYFFGREIHTQLNVPVGLIHASWGGSPIEIWLPESIIENDRILKKSASLLGPMTWSPYQPGKAYNAMIHPLIPYTIKGALWYQGETNTRNPDYYARSLATLIESWRDLWGYEFPFYYVQIAPFKGYGDGISGALVRDQQRKVQHMVPSSGMVITSDIGNVDDIHPGNKQDVGKRLAYWALHHQYEQSHIGYSGPTLESSEKKNDRIILYFDYAQGLHTMKEPLLFEINKGGEKWEQVEGIISGKRIILQIDDAFKVKKLRYAFSNIEGSSLFNSNGLPGSSFLIEFEK